MDSAEHQLPSDRFVLHSLRRDPCVTFVRGDNARLWDGSGRLYLDSMSGSAGPAMVGHANPLVAEAVARQMATLPTTNILHQSDAVVEYCARLAALTPAGLTKIALVAGGGENAMDGGYGQVAAFVMEVVQGPNGHVVFPPDYYRAVRRACDARGTLLIVDEIQTGLARCGATWASDLFDLRPDVLVAGKALGGGVPMGALAVRSDLVDDEVEAEPWNILTFMNQPLAAAAGTAVLEVVERDRLAERARRLGAHASGRFRELAERFEVIGDVRGPGLFVGVDFVLDRVTRQPATEVCADAWRFALERGLLCQFGGIGANVLKFKPPLTTPEDDFERMLGLVEEVARFIEERVHGRVGAPA